MTVQWSQFNNVGAAIPGDIVVGLRGGANVQFTADSLGNLPWNKISSAQNLLIEYGYFMTNSSPVSYLLPSIATIGQIIQIVNLGTSTVTISQSASQQVFIGSVGTTSGTGGSLLSSNFGDSITLVCSTINNQFISLSTQGNWTIT